MRKSFLCFLSVLMVVALLGSCSPLRFLDEKESLLNSVKVHTDSKEVSPADYRKYVRQEANSKWFNFLKVPLGLYCLAGSDSTKMLNKLFLRIGEAPRIYSHTATEQGVQALQTALRNKGFLHAQVKARTTTKKRRTQVVYELSPRQRWYVRTLHLDFDNPQIQQIYEADSVASLLYKGMPVDVQTLSAERSRIVTRLQNSGYYLINKEFITFKADSVTNDYGVDLTLSFARPQGIDSTYVYLPFRIGEIHLYDETKNEVTDSALYNSLYLHTKGKPLLLPRVYKNNIRLQPDSLYREKDVQQTYGSLNALDAISFSTIQLQADYSDSIAPRLHPTIIVTPSKRQALAAELEGTNTSGDLGAAVALTYSNRNLFRGAEVLSLKVRTAYEAIKGLEGYEGQSYMEYSGELNLRFPTVHLPFVKQSQMQGYKRVAEMSLQYNSQNRPEFHKRLLTASWSYLWQKNENAAWRHRLDLLGLNYIFMPWISTTFRKQYLENTDTRYSILRYSYENLLIMKTGYGFTYNSSKNSASQKAYNTNDYQVRAQVETAGNLLYLTSRMLKTERDSLGQYRVANNAFSQYVKLDIDYSKSFLINSRNSLAIHAAFGIAIPYGNSSYIPYEKRYFSGGANSVRGWSVRELGPGTYIEKDGQINFINQTGNVKLDLSVEYRTALFWKLLGAAFIDAGNIWNTRAYSGIESGQFRFNQFYKQIALSYGIGVRFNFDYFMLRLDAGMKAIHPGYKSGYKRYPFLRPNFKRDLAVHFAIGLPF